MTGNKSALGAALGGGLVGAVIAVGVTVAAGPKLFGERLVREALVNHPELLVEAGEALKTKQYAQALLPIRAQLETPYFGAWKGAAQPKVTLVYFYDYACGYCRQSNPDIERLLKENADLRVVYRELPILGPGSVVASRVALTAAKDGRFAQFHDTLYAAGPPTEQNIAVAAKAANVSAQPVDDPAQVTELRGNQMMAGQLGATGTPLFVVGDQVFNAAVGYGELKKAIATARKG
nr:DsbA family protein [uncultured Sphingomonas sp.]